MQNYSRGSGFTLLDVLITLTIGAVITTIAIPSFQGVLANQRLTGVTNNFVMSLNLAKSEAIKRVKYVSICASDDGETCSGTVNSWDQGWVIFANTSSANLGSIDAGDEIIRVFPAPDNGVAIAPAGTIGSFLSLRPSGTIGTAVANMTGTITLCDQRGGENARGVIIESSGLWRVSHEATQDGSPFQCQ